MAHSSNNWPNLREMFYPLQAVEANRAFARGSEPPMTPVSIELGVIPIKNVCEVNVIVSTVANTGVQLPYNFRIAVVGIFENSFETEMPPMEFVNGCMQILVGALRERIALLTSMGPFPRLLMPAMQLGLTNREPNRQDTPVGPSYIWRTGSAPEPATTVRE